jgi:glycosyltransferase involved in cell wall biosynthesis
MDTCSSLDPQRVSSDEQPRPAAVLHILAPGLVGGLETVVQMLASSQLAAGHRVHVALIVNAGNTDVPLARDLQQAGIDVKTVELPPRAYRQERRQIESLCRSLRPEIVHTHGYRPDVVDAPIARGLGIPTVTTVHGFVGGDWKNRVFEWLQYRAFRQFDAVVAVSRRLGDALLTAGLPHDRVHVVSNAWLGKVAVLDRVAARRELGVSDDGIRIGWVGRLSREKGPDLFLRAMGQLLDLPLQASVIGDGRQLPTLQRLARKLAVERRITWHGVIPNAARFLAAFDLLVLSSRTEGTPIVLFEAMDACVPIVATSVGGVPDVLSPDDALLVAPENVPGLSGAIRAALGSPKHTQRRAEAARRRLRVQFAPSSWVAQYGRVYAAARTR